MDAVTISPTIESRLHRIAFQLALFTILYNILEGFVATILGYDDKSLALFGFGADSFIEVISGLGIAHMIVRMRMHPDRNRGTFERTALRITGFSFYGLATGLLATGVYNLSTGHKPETTLWGVIISLVSILIMWALIYGKTKVGNQLRSEAILADAECTRVCIYMSVVLLVSSGINEITKLPGVDAIGALCLAALSFKEGKECFTKAASNELCACKDD